MTPEEIKRLIEKEVKKNIEEGFRVIHHSQITPKFIKARHLEDVAVRFGTAANRPSDGGAVNVLAYFATDTDTLSYWNGSAYVDEVLT